MGTDNHILNVRNFCTIITETTPVQRRLILKHLTRTQCVYLKEIALNILTNQIVSFSLADRKYLKTNILEVKKLASHSICLDIKKKIIEKRHLLIKKLCLIALHYFEKALLRE